MDIGVIVGFIIAAVIALLGWGFQLMLSPARYRWLGSIILWCLACLIAIASVVYFTTHSVDYTIYSVIFSILVSLAIIVIYIVRNPKQITTYSVDGKNVTRWEAEVYEIQSILIEMDAIRLKAAKKLPTKITKEIGGRIEKDFQEVFSAPKVKPPKKGKIDDKYTDNLREKATGIPLIQSALSGDLDSFVSIFEKLAAIFDCEGYGLKQALDGENRYSDLMAELALKRLKPKLPFWRSNKVFQKNIDSVNTFSYGLATMVRIRETLRESKIMPPKMKVALEAIESATGKALTSMLGNLTIDWRGSLKE